MQKQAAEPRVEFFARNTPRSAARLRAAIEIMRWWDAFDHVLSSSGGSPTPRRDREVWLMYDKAMRVIIIAQRFVIAFLFVVVIFLLLLTAEKQFKSW